MKTELCRAARADTGAVTRVVDESGETPRQGPDDPTSPNPTESFWPSPLENVGQLASASRCLMEPTRCAEESPVREGPGTALGTFRPSLRHICWLALGLFAGVGVFATVVNLAKGRPLSFILRGVLAAALVFGALVPLLAAVVWPLGVTVYAHGLRGRTKWGPKGFIAWSEIADVATHDASGLSFVIIRARGGAPAIWTLPDVLENAEFQRLVSNVAGQRNPLLVGSTLTA